MLPHSSLQCANHDGEEKMESADWLILARYSTSEMYYKATLIQKVCICIGGDRPVAQWNRTQSSEIDPYIHG